MFREVLIFFFLILIAWTYQSIRPPLPKTCGSVGGPPITAPRIKLRDGRYLAYKEHGVPRHLAKHKIVYIHGYDSCRHDAIIANNVSPDVLEELGVYIVSFDKPGYGESDPDPKRTRKSLAMDVEELADRMKLGDKFYVVGYSMGGMATWGCLKYIPHRLVGATLIAPVINYWWHGFPANLSKEAFYQQLPQDRWTLRVAHHLPWLVYRWITQKWFPACSVASRHPAIFSQEDKELIPKFMEFMDVVKRKSYVRPQGECESIHRDLIFSFGKWEFDPMDLENPFPEAGRVHLWQGYEDRLVPTSLQRYIVAKKLPWIHYHELPGDAGHFFPFADGVSEGILRSLLVDNSSTSAAQ